MAKSTKGTKVCITKGSASPTVLTPTGITGAKPAVVTVASTTGMATGDVVYVTGTGMSALDNKVFVVDSISGTGFTLVGSDATGQTFAGNGEKIEHYAAGDMVCVCASNLTDNADAPQAISVATFCDPSATIAGATASAGTIDISGYADITTADYKEVVDAIADGKRRFIRIAYPNNGWRVAPLTFSSISYETPLDGALGYTAQAVLGSRLAHVW